MEGHALPCDPGSQNQLAAAAEASRAESPGKGLSEGPGVGGGPGRGFCTWKTPHLRRSANARPVWAGWLSLAPTPLPPSQAPPSLSEVTRNH